MADKQRIAFVALCLTLACGNGAFSQDSSFGLFKLNGVETDCKVPRLADTPFYGSAKVGSGGGEELNDEEARLVYDCALPIMRRAYAESELTMAQDYLDWKRFSVLPYRSKAHGNRYLNNYANAIAAPSYAQYESAPLLPAGSVLAKDAFVVNQNGRAVFGGLQLMEKLAAGSSPETDDWRYTLILPDGRIFGRTGSERDNTVKFCHNCHKKQLGKTSNPLHFMPERYRLR